MSGLFALAEQLQGLNETLGSKQRERADRDTLRAGLETYVGPLIRAKKMDSARTSDLFQGRPLVGVDGSVNQFGSNYPYAVHLFKALAKSTMKNRAGEQAVEEISLLSPLRSEDHRRVRELVEERRDEIRVARQDEQEMEREIAESQAYGMLVDQRMVELELKSAIAALDKFDPSVMLMDGGFSRLKGKGGELWEQLEQLSEERDTVLVGVIEEVGSYRLKSRLDAGNAELLEGFVRGHDREVLFGTLDEGEWLKTSLERPIKNDFYTVFTRLSDAPQGGACDFLRSQADRVEDVIDFLYTITPEKSRGIPLWLDLVDAEVRLTKKQVDMIVQGNIDLAHIESFLRPQRERRDF